MDAARLRYVFLDRDGVINRKLPEGAWVTDWAQFEWLPGAIDAIACMVQAGLTVCLVTNQRGIALQRFTIAQLEQIHNNMQMQLAQQGARLHAIYYCPHDRGVCHCRKPGVGMFENAFHDFPGAGPLNSVMIGDSLADMQAGRSMGMRTILIRGQQDDPAGHAMNAHSMADSIAPTLYEAVEKDLGIPHCGRPSRTATKQVL